MSYIAKKDITVGWGDCDGLGIVFYPNYFRWFDEATWNYFEVIGMPLDKVTEKYQFLGLPLIDAQANFKKPVHCREKLVMHTEIVKMEKKILQINHKAITQNTLVAEGTEIRFCGVFNEEEQRLKAENFPKAFLEDYQQNIQLRLSKVETAAEIKSSLE